MNKVLKDIVKTMEFQIQQAGATVSIEQLPDCFGDDVQINQVFSNLIGNAIKYLNPERPGEITVSGKTDARLSIYCVADNGVGIESGNLDDIFEMFYRVYPAKGTGEGLGLAIVRKIVNRHHGTVWAKSEVGKGSTFFITLPNKKFHLQQEETLKIDE